MDRPRVRFRLLIGRAARVHFSMEHNRPDRSKRSNERFHRAILHYAMVGSGLAYSIFTLLHFYKRRHIAQASLD
jgi:hypothetical protein